MDMWEGALAAKVSPPTLRQLEASVRLTLARARADMQNVATFEHARDVISIMKFSMIDTHFVTKPHKVFNASTTSSRQISVLTMFFSPTFPFH